MILREGGFVISLLTLETRKVKARPQAQRVTLRRGCHGRFISGRWSR